MAMQCSINHIFGNLKECHASEMSFGGPGGGQKSAKPIPPERGSFPLEYVVPSQLFGSY